MWQTSEAECQTRAHSNDVDLVISPPQRSAAGSTKELRMSREDIPVPHDAQKAPEMATKPPRLSPAGPPFLRSVPTQGKGDGEQFLFGSWLKPGSSRLFTLSQGMMEVDKVAAGQGNGVSPYGLILQSTIMKQKKMVRWRQVHLFGQQNPQPDCDEAEGLLPFAPCTWGNICRSYPANPQATLQPNRLGKKICSIETFPWATLFPALHKGA